MLQNEPGVLPRRFATHNRYWRRCRHRARCCGAVLGAVTSGAGDAVGTNKAGCVVSTSASDRSVSYCVEAVRRTKQCSFTQCVWLYRVP